MSRPKQLWLSKIEVWTEFDPAGMELEDLAREATSGDAYCPLNEAIRVTNPDEFPATEFFDNPDEEEGQS